MNLLQLFFIHLAAVASPGPDNLLVLSHSKGSLKNSALIAAGLSTGIFVHTLLVVFGLGSLIIQSENLLKLVQWIGASYLVYIAYQCFTAKSEKESYLEQKNSRHLFKKALITFLLNPKALLYFFSILPQFIKPNSSPLEMAALCAVIIATSFAWFFTLGVVIGYSKKLVQIQSHPYYLKTVGVLFLLIAGRLLFATI